MFRAAGANLSAGEWRRARAPLYDERRLGDWARAGAKARRGQSMGKHVRRELTLKKLVARVWREADQDKIFGTAAELAYYFTLALLPLLLFLTSLIGFLPGVPNKILQALAAVAPGEAVELIARTLDDVVSKRSGGLLSFSALGTLWAASSGIAAVMSSLDIAYEAKAGRSYWRQRLVALWLTMLLSLLVVAGTVLIVFGDRITAWVTDWLALGGLLAVVWGIVGYLLGLGLLLLGVDLLYYLGPNIKQPWHWVTPGAAFAVAAFIAVSLLFSLYLRLAPSYSATYGSLGAVIVLMLWLYLAGLVVLFGAEINSALSKAAGRTAAAPSTARRKPRAAE
jgi:membrane protein